MSPFERLCVTPLCALVVKKENHKVARSTITKGHEGKIIKYQKMIHVTL